MINATSRGWYGHNRSCQRRRSFGDLTGLEYQPHFEEKGTSPNSSDVRGSRRWRRRSSSVGRQQSDSEVLSFSQKSQQESILLEEAQAPFTPSIKDAASPRNSNGKRIPAIQHRRGSLIRKSSERFQLLLRASSFTYRSTRSMKTQQRIDSRDIQSDKEHALGASLKEVDLHEFQEPNPSSVVNYVQEQEAVVRQIGSDESQSYVQLEFVDAMPKQRRQAGYQKRQSAKLVGEYYRSYGFKEDPFATRPRIRRREPTDIQSVSSLGVGSTSIVSRTTWSVQTSRSLSTRSLTSTSGSTIVTHASSHASVCSVSSASTAPNSWDVDRRLRDDEEPVVETDTQHFKLPPSPTICKHSPARRSAGAAALVDGEVWMNEVKGVPRDPSISFRRLELRDQVRELERYLRRGEPADSDYAKPMPPPPPFQGFSTSNKKKKEARRCSERSPREV